MQFCLSVRSSYACRKLGEEELLHRRQQRLKDVGSGDVVAEEELPFSEPIVQHHDALTSTTTTVTLDRYSKKATVTIVASVRGGDERGEELIESSVVLASRALARSAAALEEKANALTLSSRLKKSALSKDGTTDGTVSDRDRLVCELEKSKVVEGSQVRRGYYAGTPFRPVYKVKLEQADASLTEALLKPATPGDVQHCRWGNASSDWVAYQVCARFFQSPCIACSCRAKSIFAAVAIKIMCRIDPIFL